MGRVDTSGSCWRWLGAHTANGYGQISLSVGGRFRSIRAHRALWMLTTGDVIPAGYELDHLCSTVDCVNPAHLEMVTGSENLIRAHRQRGELGASIRVRPRGDGATSYAVLFREVIDGKVRQRSRTFLTEAEALDFQGRWA